MAGPAIFPDFSSLDLGVLHMTARELSDLIEVSGTGAELRQAMLCPCGRIETRQPRVNCPSCKGIGFTYPDHLRSPVVVLLLSRTVRQRMEAAGLHASGTSKASFPLGIIPANGDMLLPGDEVFVVQEQVHRAVAQVDQSELRSLASAPIDPKPLSLTGGDDLLYPDVTVIEAMSYVDPVTRKQTFAKEGVDFTRVLNHITWAPNRGPAVGGAYAVRYRAPAIYVCGDDGAPMRGESTTTYPYACTVQRLDRWTTNGRELRPSS